MSFISVNPSTDKEFGHYPSASTREISITVDKAHLAFKEWGQTSFKERGNYFLKIADLLRSNKEYLAALMAQEMGKPVSQGLAEIEKSAQACIYYAEKAEEFLTNTPVQTEAKESYIEKRPLGAILAIMPWNFPFWQVFRAASAVMMAGNTFILKHAPNVPACALEIVKLFKKAGFPAGTFNNLFAETADIPSIIQNPKVAAITLTGSTRAGKSVAQIAGQSLKKLVLELGGSDPYIILEDADIEQAAQACITSRMINNGQSCIAAKRFIPVGKIQKNFEEAIYKGLQNYACQNPLEKEAKLGPLARMDLRESLNTQVQKSILEGTKCLLGGNLPSSPGAFYPPTLLLAPPSNCPAYAEELFGPVATIIPAKNETHAIQIANDTVFGLGGAIFSKDLEHAKSLLTKLHTGSCAINNFVQSDWRLPFGGVKQSGYGRELGFWGIHEFVNIRSVVVS